METIQMFEPRQDSNKEPEVILDKRTWKNSTILAINLQFPVKLNSQINYRIELCKRGEVKRTFNTSEQGVYKGANHMEIYLSLEDEKKFQSGKSNSPFVLKIFDERTNDECFRSTFYRCKSTAAYDQKRQLSSTQTKTGQDVNDAFKRNNFAHEDESLWDALSFNESTLGKFSVKYLSPTREHSASNSPATSTPLDRSIALNTSRISETSPFPFDRHVPRHSYLDEDHEYDSVLLDGEQTESTAHLSTFENIKNFTGYKFMLNKKTTTSFDDSSISLDRFNEVESVHRSDFLGSFVDHLNNSHAAQKALNDDFLSFSLVVADKAPENGKQLLEDIYVVQNDKPFVSNHAIRTLIKHYCVKHFAQFKIELNVWSKTRQQDYIQDRYRYEISNLLKNGIEVTLNGRPVKMVYFGHSNSGLREKTFWTIDKDSSSRIDFRQFLNKIGDFTQFNSIEKFSKRYSLAFSSSKPTVKLEPDEYVVFDDVKTIDGKYEFTDGIGLMRISVAEQISQRLKLKNTCYVFQIRAGGFKGVLAAFPDQFFDDYVAKQGSQRNMANVRVIFRQSQLKFASQPNTPIILNVISTVNECLPSSSLNTEFLMVLDGLCESTQFKRTITDVYKKSLDEVDEALRDPIKAYNKLIFTSNGSYNSDFALKYASIILSCKSDLRLELDLEQYKIIRNQILDQLLGNTIVNKKFAIQIENSKYLMGVSDESRSLNECEVYVCYRDQAGNEHVLHNVDVIVARTPCYGLSEIQKVRARNIPALSHLVNCIAFPQRGKRPLTNILSGGDLDGDTYFISWDSSLVDSVANSPTSIEYPKEESAKLRAVLSMDGDVKKDLASYFVRSCLNADQIGLLHYNILAMYDASREKMKSREYLNAIININKAIDGLSVVPTPIYNLKRPPWYLSSLDVAAVSSAETKDAKMKALYEVLRQKNYDFDITERVQFNQWSLIGQLMLLTIKKFVELYEDLDETRAQFLTDRELDLLHEANIIDLNMVDKQMSRHNFDKIIENYKTYVDKVKQLDGKSSGSSKKRQLFIGSIEQEALDEKARKLNKQKMDLTREFKSYVIGLEYNDEEKNLPEINRKAMHTPNDLFIRTRVVNLYVRLQKTPVYYQIPWIFYDILTYLKNQAHMLQHQSTSSLVPFTLPNQLVMSLSFAKLLHNRDKKK